MCVGFNNIYRILDIIYSLLFILRDIIYHLYYIKYLFYKISKNKSKTKYILYGYIYYNLQYGRYTIKYTILNQIYSISIFFIIYHKLY